MAVEEGRRRGEREQDGQVASHLAHDADRRLRRWHPHVRLEGVGDLGMGEVSTAALDGEIAR